MKRNIRGFTLIELMVVVVILAILAAFIVPNVMGRPEQARRIKAQTDIASIQSALDFYKLDNGFYPSTDQGLEALVHRPQVEPIPQNWSAEGYLKALPIDPWGRRYHYAHPGQHGSVDIWTETSSGKEKTVIHNWHEDA